VKTPSPIDVLNFAEICLARSRAAFSRTSRAKADKRKDRARRELMTRTEREYYDAAKSAMMEIRDGINEQRKP